MQTTSTILMIRPVAFQMNSETAVNNYYQKVLDGLSADEVQEKAVNEFDLFAEKLEAFGVNVIVVNDTEEPHTPDSIFPNNWVSFHDNGQVGLYPMFAENRRVERREEILNFLETECGFDVTEIVDFTEFEEHGKFLEGTGSIVLDRNNKVAYAAISPRTDRVAFGHFCEEFDYEGVVFEAYQNVDGNRLPIYHTNVMMCIADQFAVVCMASIDDEEERQMVAQVLTESELEIIEISEEQTQRFAGNMLQVHNNKGEKALIMSESAFLALDDSQKSRITRYCPIIHSALDTIEACGGGSARCMMAEVFLPKKED
jgi:hypothetical protein